MWSFLISCSFLFLFIRFSMNCEGSFELSYSFTLYWDAIMWHLPLVGPNGLEPSTSRLSGVRSNHLSYEPIYAVIANRFWWRWWGSNPWPPACKAGALPAELHPHRVFPGLIPGNWTTNRLNLDGLGCYIKYAEVFLRTCVLLIRNPRTFSIERRWSSRTFRYGYLVTT